MSFEKYKSLRKNATCQDYYDELKDTIDTTCKLLLSDFAVLYKFVDTCYTND